MIRTDHMKLIRSIAWSFHFTTGLPFEDLYSEACLQYCIGMKDYKEENRSAKRTTFLYRYITNGLIFYIQRERRVKDIIWAMEIRRQESYHPVYEFFGNDFPPDVQTILDFIRESNGEISDVAPKIARGKIFRELIKRGWTHSRSWDAIRETRKIITQTEIGCII